MKKKVGVVCGGYSGEAVVSMKSAEMIMNQIDTSRFDPVRIVISPEEWYADLPSGKCTIDKNDFSYTQNGVKTTPDLCFIIVHGTPGEDGKLQGYFDLIKMPYTTGGVVNTALTFNKYFTTRLLKQRGFNVAESVMVESVNEVDEEAIAKELKLPLFVKPNEGGSSLGVSKVKELSELKAAVELALTKSHQVIIEEFLPGREVTCGVMNTPTGPMALHLSEVITQKEIFDFKAKYEYDQTQEITPAQVEPRLYQKCQRISEQIYKAFSCRGIVRIDYKMNEGEFYVIEINTVPGMTDKSFIPQQAEAMNIDKTTLISMVIDAMD